MLTNEKVCYFFTEQDEAYHSWQQNKTGIIDDLNKLGLEVNHVMYLTPAYGDFQTGFYSLNKLPEADDPN